MVAETGFPNRSIKMPVEHPRLGLDRCPVDLVQDCAG